MGDQSEFVELCSKAGHQACEQGQYREAIRLLHLGHLGWGKKGLGGCFFGWTSYREHPTGRFFFGDLPT